MEDTATAMTEMAVMWPRTGSDLHTDLVITFLCLVRSGGLWTVVVLTLVSHEL